MNGAQREILDEICSRIAAAGAPSLPLWQAFAEGKIELAALCEPDAEWPAGSIHPPGLPEIILIGDDPNGPGEVALGPDRWACTATLRRWAVAAIIHGGKGEPEHYAVAIDMAQRHGRVAMIETSSAKAMAWHRALGGGLLMIPDPDRVHPVAGAAR